MHDDKVFKKLFCAEGNLDEQIKAMFQFNALVEKKKKLDDVKSKINVSKYVGVFARRFFKDSIVKVRCTKPKSQNILTVHLTRKDDKCEYLKKVLCPDLVKYGYNEWLEIANIVKGHHGIHSQELNLTLNVMINKVQNLNLILTDASTSTSISIPSPVVSSR
ncbi:unnamed protein product [Lactuca virosa]|uniref:Uncharacterized protein n=1 Tax=Lactuca virosa TaxID=75947 RepID=A0AAU9MYB0_9ASTR|nr:unnamed protein product [Lactuca virosa]